ncbi:aromatic acid exporter family protein [Bacillus shivajii]|uniref:aromatic acid exporter family protein n=1 Tax=Bacillus shivajii TaxID=1983719 RepID=UPI001CF9602F|nr:aromatic acid exporter family protein [Bacillus shivajii]UCZ54633.1 aromatic acid exporter family protein [Bacillus shivajii]
MFRIGSRTVKTALGASLAIMIAQLLELEFFSSAGIITILCIQQTRRKSLQMSWARFVACIIGIVYAALVFELIGYHPLAMGILLLLFIPTTVLFKVQAGIVTSAVVILHLYSYGMVNTSIVINEIALIVIGIGCALLMNTYMPSVESGLDAMRHNLEAHFSKIFYEFSVYVRNGDSNWGGSEITKAAELLNTAKNKALHNLENHILRYEDQYYHYFKMREKQLDIIERMMPLLVSVDVKLKQGEMIADFLEELSAGVHSENTAYVYIEKLESLRMCFKGMDLPKTREEFEARSAYVQLLNEMEQYLILKSRFKPIKKYSIFR